jgi:nitrogen-specific signal transduction histidine kinase
MEERLRESERTISCLLNAIPDALALLNRVQEIVAVNDAMARKLRRPRSELVGVSMGDLIGSGVIRVSPGEIEPLFRDGTPVHLEEEQDGRWYQTAMYPIFDPAGKIARIAIQSHEITEWKSMKERMKREGLVQIEQNMEQFLTLNDQIRNPLQVISGYAELSDNQFREKIEEQVQIINDLVTRLDRGWIESEKVHAFLIRHYQHREYGEAEGMGERTTAGSNPKNRDHRAGYH